MRRLLVAAVLSLTIIGGGIATTAAPAEAATCSATVQKRQAYNVNCSYVTHWIRTDSTNVCFAAAVSPGIWSKQGVVRANETAWGAGKGTRVAYR